MSLFGNLFQKKITPEVLKKALKNDEFVFYYQPEFDLKTGQATGVEALMRWVNNRRGIVPPNEFIPVLEKSGLINEFTQMILKKTLDDLHKIHESGFRQFHMAVNFSVVQLKQPKTARLIQTALENAHINPSFVECEITESQEIDEELLNSDVFKKLEQLNVALSMDDFGTGYASFNALKNLNIKKLKIDIDFIRELFTKEKNKKIVSSMIKLGHDLGLPVLAEGIETTEQKEWLEKNGCDLGQGYWFSRPLPLDQLIAFLKKNK